MSQAILNAFRNHAREKRQPVEYCCIALRNGLSIPPGPRRFDFPGTAGTAGAFGAVGAVAPASVKAGLTFEA
jgi:hypothetical protein